MKLLKCLQAIELGQFERAVRYDETGNKITVMYGHKADEIESFIFYVNDARSDLTLTVEDLKRNDWYVVDSNGFKAKRIAPEEYNNFFRGLNRLAKGAINTLQTTDDWGTHIWFIEDGKFKTRMDDSTFLANAVITNADINDEWKGKR